MSLWVLCYVQFLVCSGHLHVQWLEFILCLFCRCWLDFTASFKKIISRYWHLLKLFRHVVTVLLCLLGFFFFLKCTSNCPFCNFLIWSSSSIISSLILLILTVFILLYFLLSDFFPSMILHKFQFISMNSFYITDLAYPGTKTVDLIISSLTSTVLKISSSLHILSTYWTEILLCSVWFWSHTVKFL
jgi:hypothetical protein